MKKLAILALLLLVSPVFAALGSNATVTPRYVDTSVINQTFVYNMSISGDENVSRIIIFAPDGYNITGIQGIALNGTSCLGSGCTNNGFNNSQINVTFDAGTSVNSTFNQVVTFTFTALTNSSAVIGNFSSNITAANGTSNLTQAVSANSLQITTQQMINVTELTMTKGVAILNGTDYWEFKFTLELAASQLGVVQFRMNDWIEASGLRIPINTSSVYYATLRRTGSNLTTFDNATNITTSYSGSLNKTGVTPEDYYLKMIIPAGTSVSNSWSTSYNFLFRSTP